MPHSFAAPRRAVPALVALAIALGAAGTARPAAATAVVRVAGPTRVATAAAVARHAFPDGAPSVVVARADDYADALAGGPLAGAMGGPVLLTGADGLAPEAAEAVADLGAGFAVVLGGRGALSDAVVGDLAALGLRVARVSGPSRWATAAAVARLDEMDASTVYLAEGASPDPSRGWPDALSASALAAGTGAAVLLTEAGALPEATREALTDLRPAQVVVVGGRSAVSDGVVGEVEALGLRVERVSGADRWATSAALADRAVAAGGAAASLWVASGRSWPDALVAGPAVAATGGVLVLVDSADLTASPATAAWIAAHRGDVATATVVGGERAVGPAVVAALSARPDAEPVAPPPVDGERWSDPATWDGRGLPREGDTVTIPPGRTVVLDVDPPALEGIAVDGTLVVAPRDTMLRANWVMVKGRLAVGAPDAPFGHRFTLELTPVAGQDVMGMGTGVLGVMGGQLDLHGRPPAPSWTRLAQTAAAGSDRLILQEAPTGWRAGDALVVAATGRDPGQAEERRIVAVDGQTVFLDAPLEYVHWGATDQVAGGAVPMHAEVGLLSRTVVVRGPADARATGQGGHVMVMGGDARLSSVELADMGQGGVMGRYPIHFHMLGSAPGSWLRDVSVHHSANRCVALHGTHDVQVAGTVAYDAAGHCYFLEDGIEQGNVLERNLGLLTRVPAEGKALLDTDRTPATFWITNPANDLVGNAAAGSEGFGIWYDLPEHPTGKSETDQVWPRRTPLGRFSDNVIHTTTKTGMFKSGSGLFVEDYEPPAPAVFSQLVSYANDSFGAWLERGVVLERAVLAGNGTGFVGREATLRDSLVVGTTTNAADQHWSMTGVGLYDDTADVADTTFANFRLPEGRAAAIGSVTTTMRGSVRFAGARFVNSDPVRLAPAWDLDGIRTTVFTDVDGSVTGAPATVVYDHPLLTEPGCTPRPDWRAQVCPPGRSFAMLRLAEEGGSAPLGPVVIARDDGAVGPAQSDPEWSAEPLALVTLPLGRSYTVALGRRAPAVLEVVLSGDARGGLDVGVPWPHPVAHVYAGWGRWARPVPVLVSAGVVRVPLALEGDTTWARWLLCAAEHCGTDIGTASG